MDWLHNDSNNSNDYDNSNSFNDFDDSNDFDDFNDFNDSNTLYTALCEISDSSPQFNIFIGCFL